MIKIGITGSTGNLGKSLINLLNKDANYKINNYKNNILNTKKVFDWVKKNQFDVIIHLAALVPTDKANKNYKLANEVNFIGTKNLVSAIKNNTKKKVYLFFSSTSHVYSLNKHKITEKFKTKGISKYGKTKIKAENFLLKNKKFFDLSIGRISSLTSEKQSKNFVIKKIIEEGKKNRNFNFGNSNIKRDFIHVDDVSKIIVKIIKKKILGVVNISNSEETHLYELLNHINKVYNFKINHFLGREKVLVLSNKLLLKKIGSYRFLKIKEIVKNFF